MAPPAAFWGAFWGAAFTTRLFGPYSTVAGVHGTARDFTGVAGTSVSHVGVYGQVEVTSLAPDFLHAGVLGSALTQPGVIGISDDAPGVEGFSLNLPGVSGFSSMDVGVFGRSETASGVGGRSDTQNGVHGAGNGGAPGPREERLTRVLLRLEQSSKVVSGNVTIRSVGEI